MLLMSFHKAMLGQTKYNFPNGLTRNSYPFFTSLFRLNLEIANGHWKPVIKKHGKVVALVVKKISNFRYKLVIFS